MFASKFVTLGCTNGQFLSDSSPHARSLCRKIHFGFTLPKNINRADGRELSYSQERRTSLSQKLVEVHSSASAATDGGRDMEVGMKLKELELITLELGEMLSLLRSEARPEARWIIMLRVQELMKSIGKGI